MKKDIEEYTHNIKEDLVLKNKLTLVETVHEYGVNPETGWIELFGHEDAEPECEGDEPGVEYKMANRFIRNLNMLQRDKNIKTILVDMKTCGGMWEEGIAIYDAIKACPKNVVILCRTHARSMSSIILQAADKRVMMPHSYFMYHMGDAAYSGVPDKIYSEIRHAKIADEQMLEIYAKQMQKKGQFKGKSKKVIKEYLKETMQKMQDVFLSPAQAIKLGLADEVFGANEKYDWNKLLKVEE